MNLVKLESPELEVIEKSKAEQIKQTFEPMVKMISEFEDSFTQVISESEKGITLDVTSKAKRLRIDIGKVRIETEKLRREQKEEYLRAGKAIDGVSNILKWAVSEKENKLKEIENYFEIQEQKRLEELQIERVELISQFVEDASERLLSSMDADVWDAYFEAKKKEYNDRIEAEKQAELERLAKEKAEKEEQERIRRENEQLKKEAEEKERLAKIEREKIEKEHDAERKKQAEILEAQRKEAEEKANKERIEMEKEKSLLDAKLKQEREEKERIEKVLSDKKKIEDDEKKALLAKEKKASLAPDKEKLIKLADSIIHIELPELKSNESKEILASVILLLNKTSDYIKEKSNTL